MRKTLVATVVALTLPLALSACSDEPEFNDADVEFASQMIPHHEQAVEMAGLARDRARSSEVRELAEKIEAAQEPEIVTMSDWLREWDRDVPDADGDHGSMAHDGDSMAGMMSDADLDALEDARGDQFDDLFLTLMIEHHEGAIGMARDQQAAGLNPEAVQLARQIETDQRAEIAVMSRLLGS